MSENSARSGNDTERQTVTITGPVRFQFELTESELEAVRESDHPLTGTPEPVEWEPVGTADEWNIYTEIEE